MGVYSELYCPLIPSGMASASLLPTYSQLSSGEAQTDDACDRHKSRKDGSETHRPYDPLNDFVVRSLLGALLVFFSLAFAASFALSKMGQSGVLAIDLRHLDLHKLWRAHVLELDIESAQDWEDHIRGNGSAKHLDLKALGQSEHQGSSKIAFMFLTRGPMPLTPLWERFLRDNTGRASVYIHASEEGFKVDEHVSKDSVFYGKQVERTQVEWGGLGMVRAERLLIAAALKDPANQRFVLVSESCIPVRSFQFVHDYLLAQNKSFITTFHSTWRFPGRRMALEIPKSKFRKGSQWVALTRKHAELVNLDKRFFKAFEETNAWVPDESYIQTVVPLLDPEGVEPRSVSYTEWPSRFAWHPRTFQKEHVSEKLVKTIQNKHNPTDEVIYDYWIMSSSKPCTLNGKAAPCFLFARKFAAETLPDLMKLGDALGY